MRRCPLLAVLALACALPATPAPAQNLSDRIDSMYRQRGRGIEDRSDDLRRQAAVARKLGTIMEAVHLENTAARDAIKWWSDSLGVSVVLNWRALENEGIYPEAPISVSLASVPARNVLELILQQLAPETPFVYDVEPGYINVLTRNQADRQLVTAVYDVADLLMEIPTFTDAPQFDLREALRSDGGGGEGGGAGGGDLFGDNDDAEDEQPLTKTERGQQLADLVMATLYPDVWQPSGGPASVRYYRNMLIVRAPKYVHRQLGIPIRTPMLPPLGGEVAPQ